jgi:lipopolysaccharide exporter
VIKKFYQTFNFYIKVPFISDSATMAAGTAISLVVGIIASPILTRMYSPKEFGVFSLFSTIISTASVIACFCYETAIVLPKKERVAAALLLLCLLLATILSVAASGVIFCYRNSIVKVLNAPELLEFLRWIPLTLFAVGAYQALNYWHIRRRQFKLISISRALQSITTVGTQIGFGGFGSGVAGLIFGIIFGQFLASWILARKALKKIVQLVKAESLRLQEFTALIYRYRNFPLYSSWGALMNTAAFQLVPPLLSTRFGTEMAGLYFLGYRLASIPMSFLGTAVGQVFLQRSADRLAKGAGISELVEKVVGKSIILCLPPFLVLMVIAPRLFSFVFGQEWETAGVYMRLMTPLYFFQFITSPVSVVLIALQKQKILAIMQALIFLGAVGSLSFAGLFIDSPVICLGLYSLVQSSIYFLYLVVIINISSASFFKILTELKV